MGSYLLNSVITTLVTLVIQVVIIVLAAYAFGKLKPWGYNALLSLLLMTMFVTSEMTTVPNYITIRDMGLMGTRWSLIIPCASFPRSWTRPRASTARASSRSSGRSTCP